MKNTKAKLKRENVQMKNVQIKDKMVQSFARNVQCDGKSNVCNPITISDGDSALRVLCTQCKKQYVIRKDWRGVCENRQYSKIFKRDVLQPRDPLFYKIYPQYLNI